MAKSVEKTPAKKATAKKATTSSRKVTTPDIEKAATTALTKLKELGLDQQLQADLEWCLGSYQFDRNPAGLYEMVQRTVTVFSVEKDKKTKGVTSKLITDLSKSLAK
jgi:hypothetical protein